MPFDVLWLSQADIDSLGITMLEIMDEVERGFVAQGRGEVEMPAKIGIHTRKDCFNHSMPCFVGGDLDMAGVKVVSGYPPNQKKGLPYITGIWCLLDPETGLVRAVMDAAWITAWRTGAASGVGGAGVVGTAGDGATGGGGARRASRGGATGASWRAACWSSGVFWKT